MRNKFFNYGILTVVLSTVILAACSPDFLERPPKDQVVDGSFFQTDDQVLASTALLYTKVWFDYNDKASYNLGDFRGGTAYSAYNDRENVEFRTTANTGENTAAWQSFFNVVGQSNLVMANINRYAGASVSPAIKAHAIAEARFMRALAYRFLVSNWGPVPIITNNQTLLTDTTIVRNTEESVWRFITSELRAVANDLPTTPIQTGRLTRWSAEGMLARCYLVRSGVAAQGAGLRDQVFLDSAKYYAKRVIDLSGAQLLGKYEDLFKWPYDNNTESLFSLQWIYTANDWGTQNSTPAYLAYSGDIANGDGWGGDKGATLWMLLQYEGFEANGKTLDQRLHATFMLPGAVYPEITQTFTNADNELDKRECIYPFNGSTSNDVNFAAIKKYVTGKAEDVGGEASQQHYGNDTYMLRLAEMYLTYAEAELANAGSTTDPLALEYFNKIHMRAGLPEFTDPLTFEDIFRERILEFAMEGMSWYDLVSLHYYDKAKAEEIIGAQDRGFYFLKPDVFPNPTSWQLFEVPWANQRFFQANDGNFHLPIPATEQAQAPNLRKDPVDYYGGL